MFCVKKSPLEEFQNYLKEWRLYGEGFVPKSNNPDSTFMEYFEHRQYFCSARPMRTWGGLTFPARPASPKIVVSDELVECLLPYQGYIRDVPGKTTKEEYYEVVDEIAKNMPEYVARKYSGLRSEIVERSGDIFRWRCMLDVENKIDGILYPKRFYDAAKKEEALSEYVEFVENLTGKKVLIGAASRMTIATDELGILNNPSAYKDVDYILFGHGKGSSLITDIEHPDTWRFSDTDESIWKFIEENIPKGKRVLVGSCEKDSIGLTERKTLEEMYDKSGNYMSGIGAAVNTAFNKNYPAKICESGVRHIIGHTMIEKYQGRIKTFIEGCYGITKNVYYDL